MAWSDVILKALKDNEVRLVAYVPDNVLTPLSSGVTSDNYFVPVCAAREDEAIGLGRSRRRAIRSRSGRAS